MEKGGEEGEGISNSTRFFAFDNSFICIYIYICVRVSTFSKRRFLMNRQQNGTRIQKDIRGTNSVVRSIGRLIKKKIHPEIYTCIFFNSFSIGKLFTKGSTIVYSGCYC